MSSRVNEVIRTIFFYEKILNAQTRKSNQNQLKNKTQRTKNNEGNNFLCTKNSKRGEIVYFAFFFYLKYLLKKFEIVLITSFTLLIYQRSQDSMA